MAKRMWIARDVREGEEKEAGPLSRLLKEGAASLSDPELLVVLFGRGQEQRNPLLELAENLISAGGGLKALCQKDPHELCSQPGMSPKKAAQMSAAL